MILVSAVWKTQLHFCLIPALRPASLVHQLGLGFMWTCQTVIASLYRRSSCRKTSIIPEKEFKESPRLHAFWKTPKHKSKDGVIPVSSVFKWGTQSIIWEVERRDHMGFSGAGFTCSSHVMGQLIAANESECALLIKSAPQIITCGWKGGRGPLPHSVHKPGEGYRARSDTHALLETSK